MPTRKQPTSRPTNAADRPTTEEYLALAEELCAIVTAPGMLDVLTAPDVIVDRRARDLLALRSLYASHATARERWCLVNDLPVPPVRLRPAGLTQDRLRTTNSRPRGHLTVVALPSSVSEQ